MTLSEAAAVVAPSSTAWLVHFIFFTHLPGELPTPALMLATNLHEPVTAELWLDDNCPDCPWDPDAVVIGAGDVDVCHAIAALGWPAPRHFISLTIEARNALNGLVRLGDASLGELALAFGLPSLPGRQWAAGGLPRRGHRLSSEERAFLLAHGRADLEHCRALVGKLAGRMDPRHAAHRGRTLRAAAIVEARGIPVDVDLVLALRETWPVLQRSLIQELDRGFDVFEAGAFREDRWRLVVDQLGIAWPRSRQGHLMTDLVTFRDMAEVWPSIVPIRDAKSIALVKPDRLSVGRDGRNRCRPRPYATVTGRDAPSTAEFILGRPVWMRFLIRPAPGWGIASVDWVAQEPGVAAALSGDPQLISAYQSGDLYLGMAMQMGAVPKGATRESHPEARELFKRVTLSLLNGMGVNNLASRTRGTVGQAAFLLERHRQVYARLWKWMREVEDAALSNRKVTTRLGWSMRVPFDPDLLRLRSFAVQGPAAELLRLGVVLAVEDGVPVVGTLYDQIFIEAPVHALSTMIEKTVKAMDAACEILLDGFVLHTKATSFTFPGRYTDPRGQALWEQIYRRIVGRGSSALARHHFRPGADLYGSVEDQLEDHDHFPVLQDVEETEL